MRAAAASTLQVGRIRIGLDRRPRLADQVRPRCSGTPVGASGEAWNVCRRSSLPWGHRVQLDDFHLMMRGSSVGRRAKRAHRGVTTPASADAVGQSKRGLVGAEERRFAGLGSNRSATRAVAVDRSSPIARAPARKRAACALASPAQSIRGGAPAHEVAEG
jgi:hypothetical protein